ncbi:MAG: hypothetical protein KatS3mg015_0045 [Fimbriimonadales bacterium]|nr:MAG: hypothetical protein KatS3mg015_0045 [Fimbriimonadales bacterium]
MKRRFAFRRGWCQHALLLAVCIGSAGWLSAQGGPTFGVTVSPEVGRIVYWEDLYDPVTGEKGIQAAQFTCTVTAQNVPPDATLEYIWSPIIDLTQPPQPPPPSQGQLIVQPPGNTAEVTAYGLFPGIFTVRCTVIVHRPGFPDQSFPLEQACAAIGGPLSLSVYDSEPEISGTPQQDSYENSKPWYLQYFGYDPAEHPPDGAQRCQKGIVALRHGQPLTVWYEWSITPASKVKVVWFNGSTLEQSTEVRVAGIQGSGYGEVTPRVKYKMEWNGTVYEYWDNSDESPPPGKTSPNPEWYRFTVHEPDDSTVLAVVRGVEYCGQPYDPQRPDYDPTPPWCWRDDWQMMLKDNLGEPMPAVWVQERFTTEPPEGFLTNCRQDPIFVWTTGSGAGSPSLGLFVDYLAAAGDGIHFFYRVPQDPPRYGPLTHVYWAGTGSCTEGGIAVGTWTMRIWYDWTLHDKQ